MISQSSVFSVFGLCTFRYQPMCYLTYLLTSVYTHYSLRGGTAANQLTHRQARLMGRGKGKSARFDLVRIRGLDRLKKNPQVTGARPRVPGDRRGVLWWAVGELNHRPPRWDLIGDNKTITRSYSPPSCLSPASHAARAYSPLAEAPPFC
jgi:hypothetical protein